MRAGPSRLLVTPAVTLRLLLGLRGCTLRGHPATARCLARARGSQEGHGLRLGIYPGGLGSVTLCPPDPALGL